MEGPFMKRHGHADEAKRILTNYFEVLARKVGMQWEADYTAELEAAIEHIIDAAVIQARTELLDDLGR